MAQQAVEALATSFSGQQEMLAASIASYTRVIATLQSKARGACAAVLKAQKAVELEERQVQSLMGKIRRTPSSALTPQLKSQMAVLQQVCPAVLGRLPTPKLPHRPTADPLCATPA